MSRGYKGESNGICNGNYYLGMGVWCLGCSSAFRPLGFWFGFRASAWVSP